MLQNDTNSILDKRMVVAAECLANPDFQGTKQDIANAAGVARSTLHRWMRNPDFIKIVNELVEKYADAELGMVWKALTRRIQTGDVQAIKLYFELRQRSEEKRLEGIDTGALKKAKEILGGVNSAIDEETN